MLHLCKELVDIQQSYIHTQVHSFLLIKILMLLKSTEHSIFYMIYMDVNLGT